MLIDQVHKQSYISIDLKFVSSTSTAYIECARNVGCCGNSRHDRRMNHPHGDWHRKSLAEDHTVSSPFTRNMFPQQRQTRRFPKLGGGYYKSSILIGYSIINHPAIGVPTIYGNHIRWWRTQRFFYDRHVNSEMRPPVAVTSHLPAAWSDLMETYPGTHDYTCTHT